MTDEEKWELWRNKNAEIKKPYGGSVHKHIVWYEGADRRKAFLDGLAEGKPKWHDLTKIDDDYPKDNRKGDDFYCKLKDEKLGIEWYEILRWVIEYQTEDIYQIPIGSMFISKDGKDMSNEVIAWCELPRFEEE